MLLKYCTEYASKLGKCSSGHRTGKGQFLFQSQRKAMPKNVRTTTQLHSSHMRVKQCSKSFKLGFSSSWTKNFQMYKLDLEKAEEPETNCQHLLDHRKSKRIPEKHLLLLYWLCQSIWLWITTVKILKDMGIPDHWPASWEICMQVRKQKLELHVKQQIGSK